MFADDLQPAGSRQMEQVISCGTSSTNSTSPLIIQISRVEKSWREVMTYVCIACTWFHSHINLHKDVLHK